MAQLHAQLQVFAISSFESSGSITEESYVNISFQKNLFQIDCVCRLVDQDKNKCLNASLWQK